MSKLLDPSVTVVLDKERHLVYGAAAFIEFKDLRGQDLLKFLRQVSQYLSGAKVDGEANPEFELPLKDIRDVLWAGLIHEDEYLTPKQVGNMFSIRDLGELLDKISKAVQMALPDMPDDGERPTRAPTRNRVVKSIGAA